MVGPLSHSPAASEPATCGLEGSSAAGDIREVLDRGELFRVTGAKSMVV